MAAARSASRMGGSRASVPRAAASTPARARSTAVPSRSPRTCRRRSTWRATSSSSIRWISEGSLLGLLETIHADDGALPRLDRLLEAEGGLVDLVLEEALFDRGDGTAHRLDPLQVPGGTRLELGRERSTK